MTASRTRAASLALVYFTYYAMVGVWQPFAPAYFKGLGLTGGEVGVLLAVTPALSILAPPSWGRAADRTGRPERVLRVVLLGALLCFLPLFAAGHFAAILPALAVYAVFASSITTLVDSLALQHVLGTGGSYAHLRLFGSLGFVASAALFGAWVDVIDQRVLGAAWVALAGCLALSFALRAPERPLHLPDRTGGAELLRMRDLQLLLAAAALHWIACAPFHGTFSIHVTRLGLAPKVVGGASALGVIAEVLVMLGYPRLVKLAPARTLLVVAYLATALRWAGMALAHDAWSILLLSLLHGASFGLFYVATVSVLAERVPAHLRATGQALFVAVTFGVGGIVGFLAAGTGYDLLGGHTLFGAAALLELVPVLLAWRLARG